jgi:r-opsin
VSIWLITAISLTRLVTFYRGPVAANIYRPHFIIVAFIIPVLATVPPVFGWSRYTLEGFLTTCSFDYITLTWSNRAFVAYLYALGFVLPCALIAFSYVCIATALHRHNIKHNTLRRRNSVNDTAAIDGQNTVRPLVTHDSPVMITVPNVTSVIITSESGTRTATTNVNDGRREHKAMMTIVYVFGAFLLAWLPYALLGAFGQMGGTLLITPYFAATAGVLAKSSRAYNPIIYAIADKQFQYQMKVMLDAFVTQVRWMLSVSACGLKVYNDLCTKQV